MSGESVAENLAIPTIDLRGHQCFPDNSQPLKLGKYTFVYGPNGTGKSSLLRELRDFAEGQGDSFNIKAFDQVFVRNLLNPDFTFEGVLHVVDTTPEISQRIEALAAPNGEISQTEKQLLKLNKTLETKKSSLEAAERTFQQECWDGKMTVPIELREFGLKSGYGSKARLAEAVEKELKGKQNPDFSNAETFDQLSERLAELEGSEGEATPPLLPCPESLHVDEEIELLLNTRLKPNEENPLTQFIEEKGLSDLSLIHI